MTVIEQRKIRIGTRSIRNKWARRGFIAVTYLPITALWWFVLVPLGYLAAAARAQYDFTQSAIEAWFVDGQTIGAKDLVVEKARAFVLEHGESAYDELLAAVGDLELLK